MPNAAPGKAPPARLAPETMARRLEGFLAHELGLAPGRVRVRDLRRMAGGASREIWSLDAAIEREGEREELALVLRRDPPGRVGDAGNRLLELRLLEAAHAAGVPVPRPRWGSEDASIVGSPFYLMDRVEGETLPRRLLSDPRYARVRRRMAARLGEILARIHSIDLSHPGLEALPAPEPGASPAQTELERCAAAIRALAVEPHPVLDLAERWLRERAPEPVDRTLVHGDFRIGNVIFDERDVRAILDWELTHVGDPIEDLGWLCTRAWRFGADDLPAGGVGTRDELVAAYERASGRRVPREALRFWEAYGSFKVAMVFLMQVRVFLDGRVASVELASLGRRVAEAEQELVRFLREEP